MKGSTHRMFAPIFATGIAYPYLIQQNKLNLPIYLSVPIFAGVIGASYLSANWADADCHAYKPKSVIMGTAKRNKDGYYYVRNKKTKELEKMSGVKRPDMKMWALFFKSIGATEHRGVKSHSPIVWLILWMSIIMATLKFPDYFGLAYLLLGLITIIVMPSIRKYRNLKKYGMIGIILTIGLSMTFPAIPKIIGIICSFGFMLGYMSHLVGDLFTDSGLPLFGKVGISPMKAARVGKFQFFKASNQLWNVLFLIGSATLVYVLLFKLSPSDAFAQLSGKVNTVKESNPSIFDGIKNISNTMTTVLLIIIDKISNLLG